MQTFKFVSTKSLAIFKDGTTKEASIGNSSGGLIDFIIEDTNYIYDWTKNVFYKTIECEDWHDNYEVVIEDIQMLVKAICYGEGSQEHLSKINLMEK